MKMAATVPASSTSNAQAQKSYSPRVEEVYEFVKALGHGTFSTVYLGRHRATKEEVALKTVFAEKYRNDARAKELLRVELLVLHKLRSLRHHPHLVQFKHAFEDREKIVLVTELCRGGELLGRIISKGRYSERDASQVLAMLAKALSAMHATGVIHRDLKPENVLYCRSANDSAIKITDFGLSMILKPGEKRGIDHYLVGTPGYLCPEVVRKSSSMSIPFTKRKYEYTSASDCWALGVIAFILLSGSPPFTGRSHSEIFEKIKAGHWSFRGRVWKQISEPAKRLIKKLMVVEPTARLTADQVLEDPWVKQYSPTVHLADTVEALKKFNARSKFKAATLACIASARLRRVAFIKKGADALNDMLDDISLSTEEDLCRLRTAFGEAANHQGCDSDNQKEVLNFQQFKDVMTNLGFNHLPLERLFDVYDIDGDGIIDYREFLLGVSKFRLTGTDALKFCFQVFDRDGSATISRAEFIEVFVHAFNFYGPQLATQLEGIVGAKKEKKQKKKVKEEEEEEEGQAIIAPAQQQITNMMEGLSLMQNVHTVATAEVREAKDENTSTSAVAVGQEAGGTRRLELLDLHHMEVDSVTYEASEMCVDLFEFLDRDHDDQVSWEEFYKGVIQYPKLLDIFMGRHEADKLPRMPAEAGAAAGMKSD